MNKWLTQVAVAAVIIVIVTWFIWGRLKSPQSAGNESPKSNTTSYISTANNNGQAAAVTSSAAGGGATEPRIEEAKWTEARAAAGTIATAIRAYCAEVGPQGRLPRDISVLGITPQDLNGNYFGPADYTFSISSMDPLTFVVTCVPGSKPNAPKYPTKRTLDSEGNWRP